MGDVRYVWNPETDAVLHEKDGTGATLATYDVESVPFGRVISQNRSGQKRWQHHDGLGNVVALSDETGAVTDTYTYDAWGNQIAGNGTTPNPYRFGGEHGYQTDPETGAISVRRRTYMPTIARWTSADPLVFPMSGPNRFAYVMNRPTAIHDPSGLQSLEELIERAIRFADGLAVAAAAAECKQWAANEGKQAEWLKKLPDCPCFVCEADETWTTPVDADQRFHPGADDCIRSAPKALPSPGQQCCYKRGRLITGGPAAGTPDRVGPGPGNVYVLPHYRADVQTYFVCKRASLLDLYLQARPPNKGSGCDEWIPRAK